MSRWPKPDRKFKFDWDKTRRAKVAEKALAPERSIVRATGEQIDALLPLLVFVPDAPPLDLMSTIVAKAWIKTAMQRKSARANALRVSNSDLLGERARTGTAHPKDGLSSPTMRGGESRP